MNPSGTSGVPSGPELLIADDLLRPLDCDRQGNIFIRGPPCFSETIP